MTTAESSHHLVAHAAAMILEQKEFSLLITKMVTWDLFEISIKSEHGPAVGCCGAQGPGDVCGLWQTIVLSLKEGEDFCALMVFVKPKYKPPSWWTTVPRVEKMLISNMLPRWLLVQTHWQLSPHQWSFYSELGYVGWCLTDMQQWWAHTSDNTAAHLKTTAEERHVLLCAAKSSSAFHYWQFLYANVTVL